MNSSLLKRHHETLPFPPGFLEQFDLESISRKIAEELTPRQRCLLAWVADSATNDAIASELNISVKTIESELTLAYRALGITNRIHAAVLWVLATEGETVARESESPRTTSET